MVDRFSTQLSKMSIDPKVVELTADAVTSFLSNKDTCKINVHVRTYFRTISWLYLILFIGTYLGGVELRVGTAILLIFFLLFFSILTEVLNIHILPPYCCSTS